MYEIVLLASTMAIVHTCRAAVTDVCIMTKVYAWTETRAHACASSSAIACVMNIIYA